MSDKMVMRGGVQDFQTYYEILVPWVDGDGTHVFNVNSGGWRFSPNDLTGSEDETIAASLEQYSKLQYYFNMFEQFKLCKVAIKYKPRWTQLIPIYFSNANIGDGYNAAQQITPDTAAYYNQNSSTQVVSVPTYMNSKEIFMIHDNEDIITRAGNTAGALDELFQARLQDGLRRCHSTESCELTLLPHYTDVIEAAATEEDVTPAPSGLLPKPTEWMTTKVFNTGTSAITLNLTQEFFGFKWWIYDPYSVSTNTHAYNIGKFEATYFWTFRYLDNRALVTLLTLTEPNEERAKKRRLEQLMHPGGRLMSVYQHRGAKAQTKLARAAQQLRLTADPPQPAPTSSGPAVHSSQVPHKPLTPQSSTPAQLFRRG